MALTDRQQEIYGFIRSFVACHGYPPSIREIAKAHGISSPNGVACTLKAIEREGKITRDKRLQRALRVPLCDDDLIGLLRARIRDLEAENANLHRLLGSTSRNGRTA